MAEEYRGALLDDRPLELVERDFRHEEIQPAPAAGLAGGMREKSIDEIPFFEIRDQDGSSTCMNQAYAKLRGILTQKKAGQYVSLSGGFAYRRRRNQDSEGMYLFDIFELGKANGLPFEAIDPSQQMSEVQIVGAREIPYADDVAKLFTDNAEKFLYLPADFDTIASVIEQGFPVLLMIYANRNEYDIVPHIVDVSLTPAQAAIRHGICGHTTTGYRGADHIVIDDSWGILNSKAETPFEEELKKRGQRLLTREWVNKRVYGAAYIRELRFGFEGGVVVPTPNKPSYNFTKQLKWIPWDNAKNTPADMVLHAAQMEDVVALQNILKYEGVFDKSVASTGYYGNITARAVDAFQRKHAVASTQELDEVKGKIVGPKTLAKLNTLYA